ncbi:MAG: hypothetical protein ACFBSG_11980 [Leptolyngbyaceae cyanobacterium]
MKKFSCTALSASGAGALPGIPAAGVIPIFLREWGIAPRLDPQKLHPARRFNEVDDRDYEYLQPFI